MVTVVSIFWGAGVVYKNTVTIVTTDTGNGRKVKGAYLRVEIAERQYNPNPLTPRHGQHLPVEERPCLSSCLTASEIKFREAVRPPFSKGDEYWGGVRRRRGKAPSTP